MALYSRVSKKEGRRKRSFLPAWTKIQIIHIGIGVAHLQRAVDVSLFDIGKCTRSTRLQREGDKRAGQPTVGTVGLIIEF